MRKVFVIIGIVVVLSVAAWYTFRGEEATTTYRFATVERGDLESTVSSTGTLSAVRTVDVGTQVSGQISELFVDFNDQVKAGQLVARIDPTLLRLAVDDSRANLERSQAELLQAEREFARKKQLFESKVMTEEEFNAAEYGLALAKANLTRAQVDLTRTERNLTYTQIYSPIDGVVIERNVDVGQTVAANFSAPTLFLLATDLSKLEIRASVDESDIGLIKDGMKARFTVQAYPDDIFEGTVRQVRLQSTNQENVVNYTVVVDVENAEGRLLPGMTATVDFLIETASDVMKIANAALRFQPTESMIETFRARMERMRAAQDSTGGTAGADRGGWQRGGNGGGERGQGGSRPQGGFPMMAGGPGGAQGGMGGGRPRNFTRLWYFDENGELAMMPVRTGISDGQQTEIIGPNLEEGLQIISGVTQTVADEGTSLNPFQQNNQQQRRGPPGPF